MKKSTKLSLLFVTASALSCFSKADADVYILYETVLNNLTPIKYDSGLTYNNAAVESTGNTLSGSFFAPQQVTGSTLAAPWSTKFATLISTSEVVTYNFTNVAIPAHSSVWVSCWFNTETGHETFNWAPSPDAEFAFITRDRIWNTAAGAAFLAFGS